MAGDYWTEFDTRPSLTPSPLKGVKASLGSSISGPPPIELPDLSYMVDAIPLDAVTHTVIARSGNAFWICYSTNSTDVLWIALGDRNPQVPMVRGTRVDGVNFDKLVIDVKVAVAGAVMYIVTLNVPAGAFFDAG